LAQEILADLKTSEEEQSDLNTFWGKEQSTDQTINRRYSPIRFLSIGSVDDAQSNLKT
jgi:hypothetical protein